jgi:hypothetical protein
VRTGGCEAAADRSAMLRFNSSRPDVSRSDNPSSCQIQAIVRGSLRQHPFEPLRGESKTEIPIQVHQRGAIEAEIEKVLVFFVCCFVGHFRGLRSPAAAGDTTDTTNDNPLY